MKHIKIFESNSLTITTVDFTGGGDGVYALYIDGKLHKYGDYYHDKIEEWTIGFIDGIKFTGTTFTYNKVKCVNDDLIYKISDLADTPPTNLSEI